MRQSRTRGARRIRNSVPGAVGHPVEEAATKKILKIFCIFFLVAAPTGAFFLTERRDGSLDKRVYPLRGDHSYTSLQPLRATRLSARAARCAATHPRATHPRATHPRAQTRRTHPPLLAAEAARACLLQNDTPGSRHPSVPGDSATRSIFARPTAGAALPTSTEPSGGRPGARGTPAESDCPRKRGANATERPCEGITRGFVSSDARLKTSAQDERVHSPQPIPADSRRFQSIPARLSRVDRKSAVRSGRCAKSAVRSGPVREERGRARGGARRARCARITSTGPDPTIRADA